MYPLKTHAFEEYYREIDRLGDEGLLKILDEGKKWDLSDSLKSGGSAIFPHTFISECGYQIASVVHGCLNSGAQTVLVLGVLHALTDELLSAREKEKAKEDISNEQCWGIWSPHEQSPFLEKEFSLHFFKTLWDLEITRRSHKIPNLVFKYPFLVNRAPQLLPGIDELKRIASDAVVVATADLFHYGKAYDYSEEKPICNDYLLFAQRAIDEGFKILKIGDYEAYADHCDEFISDSINSCSVLRYLLGPLKAIIRDIKLVDTAHLFEGNATPSWVAATLVEMQKPPLPID